MLLLYLTVYAVALHEVVFPSWYFQGVQRMRFVTYLQLAVRLSTIPLIFIFIHSPADLELYAVIVSVWPLLGTAYTVWYLKRRDGLTYALVPPGRLKTLFRDSPTVFLDLGFRHGEAGGGHADYRHVLPHGRRGVVRLGQKLITIPRLMINNINAALFPDVVRHAEAGRVKRLIRYETFIGLAVVAVIVALGYWAVLLLGGRDMLGAYPLAVALSVTVYTWLVVGGYINYVFVPKGRYYFVTKNQLVALVTFVVCALAGVFVCRDIFVVVAAYSLSWRGGNRVLQISNQEISTVCLRCHFLVPVYNVSAYIGRCARSLFEQTFDDIEYIFVNDCTPDDSMERLEAVIEQYPERAGQVKIINQEQNQGLAVRPENGFVGGLRRIRVLCGQR